MQVRDPGLLSKISEAVLLVCIILYIHTLLTTFLSSYLSTGLYYSRLCCIALRYITLHNTLHRIALHYFRLQRVTWITSHCSAVHCAKPHHTTPHEIHTYTYTCKRMRTHTHAHHSYTWMPTMQIMHSIHTIHYTHNIENTQT